MVSIIYPVIAKSRPGVTKQSDGKHRLRMTCYRKSDCNVPRIKCGVLAMTVLTALLQHANTPTPRYVKLC